jgi:predicted esterase
MKSREEEEMENSMSELTFDALERQLFAFYTAKEYSQAFELLEREKNSFPDHIREITYWRLCMHALLGKPAEVLAIFREVLDRGDWFPPKFLKEDPDLASLQQLPEYQQMVEVCRQRLDEVSSSVRPELLVREPEKQQKALPLLIALHGNNGNMNNTVEHWSGITTHNWLLAVPQSSQIIGPDAFVWDERELGIKEVREHLAKLSSEYPIDPERVVLGGFSMGGGQAIWMALHQSIKTRGFVVLGPYLRAPELEALPTLLASRKPGGLRGFIIVGDKDIECLGVSRKVAEIMQEYDLPCQLEILPDLPHNYPPDFAEYVLKGLAFVEQG